MLNLQCHVLFFFNDTATTEIYTLSLHDALPIFDRELAVRHGAQGGCQCPAGRPAAGAARGKGSRRSEEHTSELQSLRHLVCRLLLEKKNTNDTLTDLDHSTHPIVTLDGAPR